MRGSRQLLENSSSPAAGVSKEDLSRSVEGFVEEVGCEDSLGSNKFQESKRDEKSRENRSCPQKRESEVDI